MFTAARDPLPSHRSIEYAGISDNLLDGFSVAPAAQGILSLIVERNIEHGTKIEIESEDAKQTSSDIAVAADKIEIVLIAQLLRVWGLTADQS